MLSRSSRRCRQWKEVGAIFTQSSRGNLLKCCDSFLHDCKDHNLEALRRHNVNFIALLNLEGIVRTIQLSTTTASSSTQTHISTVHQRLYEHNAVRQIRMFSIKLCAGRKVSHPDPPLGRICWLSG